MIYYFPINMFLDFRLATMRREILWTKNLSGLMVVNDGGNLPWYNPSKINKTYKSKHDITPNHAGELLLMAEILHQLIGSLSHFFQGFSTIPGG